jgi:hypothetical protein
LLRLKKIKGKIRTSINRFAKNALEKLAYKIYQSKNEHLALASLSDTERQTIRQHPQAFYVKRISVGLTRKGHWIVEDLQHGRNPNSKNGIWSDDQLRIMITNAEKEIERLKDEITNYDPSTGHGHQMRKYRQRELETYKRDLAGYKKQLGKKNPVSAKNPNKRKRTVSPLAQRELYKHFSQPKQNAFFKWLKIHYGVNSLMGFSLEETGDVIRDFERHYRMK